MKKFRRFLLVTAVATAIFFFMSKSEIYDSFTLFKGSLIIGFFVGLFSLLFPTKEEAEKNEAEAKAKREARKREEEAKELARNGPGCYSKDNVDIVTFGSENNLLTVGNNVITMKIRNKNSYDVIVTVRFKYSDGWENGTKNYQISGNEMKTINTLGKAWSKAKDVTIVAVH